MIRVEGLYKKFGTKVVADGLDLTIPSNALVCVIGRSGEGKSVLLKQIIGLVRPDEGRIFIDGLDVTALEPQDCYQIFQKCGYVFQFAALLDSMTVYDNVALPLLQQGVDPDIVREQTLLRLQQVQVSSDALSLYPSEVSGGTRKRIGLARTLMLNPQIIFYDEPTSGLDPITSQVVHELIRETHDRLQMTSVVVSHDPAIFAYVDYVALLHQGKIVAWEPAQSLQETKNPYLLQFLSAAYRPIKGR
jgi:phospholipid/cholesterol/gamma-HCH transport system ATP-binding protein